MIYRNFVEKGLKIVGQIVMYNYQSNKCMKEILLSGTQGLLKVKKHFFVKGINLVWKNYLGQLSAGNDLGAFTWRVKSNYPWDNYPGSKCPGPIFWGQLPGGKLFGGQLSLKAIVLEAIFLGSNCPGQLSGGQLLQNHFINSLISRGNLPSLLL